MLNSISASWSQGTQLATGPDIRLPSVFLPPSKYSDSQCFLLHLPFSLSQSPGTDGVNFFSSSASLFPVSSKSHGLAIKSQDPEPEQGLPRGDWDHGGRDCLWEVESWRRQSHCFPEMSPKTWWNRGEIPWLLPFSHPSIFYQWSPLAETS